MTIGIVTQPLYDNYGGILQNWALQQVLKDMGNTPITLDAYMKYPRWRYMLSYSLTSVLRAFGFDRRYPVKSYRGRIFSRFTSEFIHKNLNLSKPFNKYSSSIIAKNKIDAIIVGSDQVWRPKYNSNILDMYLDFAKEVECKKIAYAASFGVDEWEYSDEEKEKCRELIKQFRAVSVREQSGGQLCKMFLGVDAEIVLDPTLLLSRDKYEAICATIPKEKEKYLAAYCLDATEEKMKIIESWAAEKKLKLKIFSAHGKNTLTIPQWLSMFRDAEEVITDSFHGTVFSIIFNKQFVSLPNENRGKSRMESLYKLFEIESSSNCVTMPIDYVHVNRKWGEQRAVSLKFLIDNLNN